MGKAIAKMETRIRELESEMHGRDQESPQVRATHQGAAVWAGRGQEEPREHAGPDRQPPAEDQDVQEADRGGRRDCLPQPGQVQASLGASIERADLNEQALAKSRARARSMSVG